MLGESCSSWLREGVSANREVKLLHNPDTQCTEAGRDEAKEQRKIFTSKSFLSCHKM